MKAFKKITDTNKSLVAFVLVFLFGIAGIGKGINVKYNDTSKKNISKQTAVFEAEDDLYDSLLSPLIDVDIDDANFIIPEYNILVKPELSYKKARNKTAFFPVIKSTEASLYDLYCNWKFHLA